MNNRITCPVCNITGTLILKKSSTKTNGKIYHYKKWNVYHHSNRKWCYLNKGHMNLAEIKSAIEAAQTLAQNNVLVTQSKNNGFSRVFKENTGFLLEPGMGFEPICSVCSPPPGPLGHPGA
jgi:hypothetical protein